MKEFKANDKIYQLDENLRSQIRPLWQEMLLPAKDRILKDINIAQFVPSVFTAENNLNKFNNTFVGKDLLEVGCNEGLRSYLLARFQDTTVLGRDIDEYTIEQSPDLNSWNPEDVIFIHNAFDKIRENIAKLFPIKIQEKVTFKTCDIKDFIPQDGIYDLVVSWDTIEHLIDLPLAFKCMADCLYTGGISYHEYNPFFAINGGHSLCTLDFYYGHCQLKEDDFIRYIKEIRPEEEKIDINFYLKCLNRATIQDVKQYAQDAGFEILMYEGSQPFGKARDTWITRIKNEFLPEVKKIYPNVELSDLLYDTFYLVMRKK